MLPVHRLFVNTDLEVCRVLFPVDILLPFPAVERGDSLPQSVTNTFDILYGFAVMII
jgi:hypothetical protein